MRILVLFLVMLLSACQTAPKPAPPAMQTWDEYKRSHPDSFIQSYNQQLQGERARLEARGLQKEYESVWAIVDRNLPPGDYTMQATGANASILRVQRVDSTTNLLVNAGYRARHLAAPQQAYSVVRAAASGWGDTDSLVLVAPIVLIGVLARSDERSDGSGQLVYRVSESIKSAPPIGTEFRLPLRGPMPPFNRGPGDPPPPPPPPNPPMHELSGYKSAVFFFQPSTNPKLPGATIDAIGSTLFGPMPVEGERALPGYHSGTPGTTVAAIRATARAQQCSPGYLPVVATNEPPQRC